MSKEFQVVAKNAKASFSLKLHRGDGMTLLGMNWKRGRPPRNFVGFAIEYKEPEGHQFFAIRNRIGFPHPDGSVGRDPITSLLAPIQKFRWVHFPTNADLEGAFTYRVTPVFMSAAGELNYGEPQEADIVLARETYPGKLNIAFTRGFVSSQAFVNRYVTEHDGMQTLVPGKAEVGLAFVPTHPKANEALRWMGFEARGAILDILDAAIADATALVRIVCYELNDPSILSRLEALGNRLWIIIDDSADHKKIDSPESQAAARLAASAGEGQVKRHHMSNLQHNKFIVVDGRREKTALCGSTNFSWRGQFVQSNNAVVVRGSKAIQPFVDAFESYWIHDFVKSFGPTPSTSWTSLGLAGIQAQVTFSPHAKDAGVLQSIADDILGATSSVFYSLAFLNQTGGAVTDAIKEVTAKDGIFVYGISDKKTGGLDVQLPNGKIAPVFAANLSGNLPEPFRSEPTALGDKGVGTRMHHKFVVIDFDKPTARVYTGSYNFSKPADNENGENLLLIRDRRIAVSYMIEALTLFDHYHFRVARAQADAKRTTIHLLPAPKAGQNPWWLEDYEDERKILDRKLFA